MEVLPQLLPIFTCSAVQRRAYGCSIPAPPPAPAEASPSETAASLPPPNAASSDALTLQRRMREAIGLAAGSGAVHSGELRALSGDVLYLHSPLLVRAGSLTALPVSSSAAPVAPLEIKHMTSPDGCLKVSHVEGFHSQKCHTRACLCDCDLLRWMATFQTCSRRGI